jgi:hypothetical protein
VIDFESAQLPDHSTRARDDDRTVPITLATVEYDALDSAAQFLRARAGALETVELGSLGVLLRIVAGRLEDVHHRWHRAKVVAAGLQAAHANCGYCVDAARAPARSAVADPPTGQRGQDSTDPQPS